MYVVITHYVIVYSSLPGYQPLVLWIIIFGNLGFLGHYQIVFLFWTRFRSNLSKVLKLCIERLVCWIVVLLFYPFSNCDFCHSVIHTWIKRSKYTHSTNYSQRQNCNVSLPAHIEMFHGQLKTEIIPDIGNSVLLSYSPRTIW